MSPAFNAPMTHIGTAKGWALYSDAIAFFNRDPFGDMPEVCR